MRVIDESGRTMVLMTGSNMGKTDTDTLRRLAGDYTREEVDAAMQRTVTGRTPSRGPGFIVPGEYREIDCTHLAPCDLVGASPWSRITRSRYQAEAIRNGDLTIIKGCSPGMSWGPVTYGVNVCDVCGCVHRSPHGYICNSCFDGMQQAQMKLAMDSFVRAANTLAKAFRDAGNALGDCCFYGPPPMEMAFNALRDAKRFNPLVMIHPTEPDARRFASAHIDPFFDVQLGVPWQSEKADPISDIQRARDLMRASNTRPEFDNFTAGLIDSIAATFDIPRSSLLTPTPFSRGNDFSDILRRYGMECPRPAEPVMKRNKRNRGPKQHGKWWLK